MEMLLESSYFVEIYSSQIPPTLHKPALEQSLAVYKLALSIYISNLVLYASMYIYKQGEERGEMWIWFIDIYIFREWSYKWT